MHFFLDNESTDVCELQIAFSTAILFVLKSVIFLFFTGKNNFNHINLKNLSLQNLNENDTLDENHVLHSTK